MGTHPIFESDFDCLTDDRSKWSKMEELPDPADVPEYLFSIPEEEPNPELLKLLPEKSTLEQFVDVGIYFVAVFQIICFFACFFLPEIKEEEQKKGEEDSQKKETSEKKSKESKKNK